MTKQKKMQPHGPKQMTIGGVPLTLEYKNIKNINLKIRRSDGAVRLSVPYQMPRVQVELFVRSKLSWIKKHQVVKPTVPGGAGKPVGPQYANNEATELWGGPGRLRIVGETDEWYAELVGTSLVLHVDPKAGREIRQRLVEDWRRGAVLEKALPLVETWSKKMGVTCSELKVQNMTTRWGSCTPSTGRIRLNSTLSLKDPKYLEYVVVHELAHLIEHNHGPGFRALMTKHVPNWEQLRAEMNGRGGADVD
jgi:predicted metal-dependent hydrolase